MHVQMHPKGQILFHQVDDPSASCSQLSVTQLKYTSDSITSCEHVSVPL